MENRMVCDVLQHSDTEGEFRRRQPASSSNTLGESEAHRAAEEEEEAGRLCPQQSSQTPAEDSESDEILLEDDQVDDFASSVLAAISCWHYGAQALLSTGVTMVTVRLSAASQVFFVSPPNIWLPALLPSLSGSVTN